MDKLSEETEELRQAVEKGDAQGHYGIREEVGDVLFTAVKVARDAGVDPEEALHAACDKFNQRFPKVEQSADKPLSEMTPEELAGLWRAAKKESIRYDRFRKYPLDLTQLTTTIFRRKSL